MLKVCFECKKETPKKNGWCSACERIYKREYHKKNRDRVNNRKKAALYKISIEEVIQLIAKGKCDICNNDCKVVIDHCHKTGKVRGALCHRCNLFLGKLEAHRKNLAKFLDYLNQ